MSESVLLTPEERMDIIEHILLGRTITKIARSRDNNGHYTGFVNIWFNDGGMLKLEDNDNTMLLDPPVDVVKLSEGKHWREAMPDLSYKLLESARKELEARKSG